MTIGIFDPLEPITQGTPTPRKQPRLSRQGRLHERPVYVSATFISQKHEGVIDAADFDSFGFDVGGKVTFGQLEFLAWYYQGKGMGTTALYLFGDDAGRARSATRMASWRRSPTSSATPSSASTTARAISISLRGEAPSNLVETNEKYTLGAYYSLTENLDAARRIHRHQGRGAQWHRERQQQLQPRRLFVVLMTDDRACCVAVRWRLAACSESSCTVAHADRAYVSNEDGHSVSVFDTDRLGQSSRQSTSASGRAGLKLNHDGSRLFVAVSGLPKCPPTVPDEECAKLERDLKADGIAIVDTARTRSSRCCRPARIPSSSH